LLSSLDPEFHIKLGESLSPLRQEGILIVCSGQMTHNLSDIRSPGPKSSPVEWAVAFSDWVHETLQVASKDYLQEQKKLFSNYQTLCSHSRKAHPREEHLIPLHVALGALGTGNGLGDIVRCRRIYDEIVLGSMSLDSYIFE
jgi:4,5-DOPA dioxygenase extradiol